MPSSDTKLLRALAWEKLPTSVSIALLAVHVLALLAVVYVLDRSSAQETKQVLVNTLGESFNRFADTVWPESSDPLPTVHERIRHFSQFGAWDGLRLVNEDGEIISSFSAEELGTRHWRFAELQKSWPTALTMDWRDRDKELLEHVAYWAPLPGPAGRKPLVLEGVVRLCRLIPPTSPFNRMTLGIVVLSLLLLLVLSRLLQRHFQPLTNIGSNLIRHQQHLREELSSLRLATEASAVARTWNQLLRLVEDLKDSAGKASADRELSTALQHSAAAAFVEAASLIPEGMIHLTGGDRISYANALACRLLGIQTAGLSRSYDSGVLHLAACQATPSGRKIIEAIESARSNHQYEAKSVRVPAEDDSTFHVRIMPVVRKNRMEDALILISDVSQQAKADRAREDFVAHVAHELRTPLTNIQAYAETYAEFDDAQVQTECFNVINKETRRLARLVEEMLSRSQLDLGTMTIRRDDVNVLDLLHEAVRDLRATAEARNIQLTARLPAKLPVLFADRDKLAVVFNNLLGNAVKYTGDGGTVTLHCEVSENQICIHFTDTGIGLAPEDQPKVFERMFRVDREEVRAQAGTGIGLTTALQITRAHGGDIRLVSELSAGSTFTVQLPLDSRVVT